MRPDITTAKIAHELFFYEWIIYAHPSTALLEYDSYSTARTSYGVDILSVPFTDLTRHL